MTIRVLFTQEQLELGSKLKDEGVMMSVIAKELKSNPITTKRHIQEFEDMGYEGYVNRFAKNEESVKLLKTKEHLQAIINKNAILTDLVIRGDIEICQEFIREYDGLDYSYFERMDHSDGVSIESIIYSLRKTLEKRNYKNRFAVVAFER